MASKNIISSYRFTKNTHYKLIHLQINLIHEIKSKGTLSLKRFSVTIKQN